LSIRAKILMGFFAVLLLVLFSNSILFFKVMRMEQDTRNIANNSIPSMKITGELHGDLASIPRMVSDLTLEEDVSTRAKIEKNLNETINTVNENIDLYKQKHMFTAEDKRIINQLSQDWNEYLQKVQLILEAVKNNDSSKVKSLRAVVYPLVVTIQGDMDNLFQLNEKLANEKCSNSSRSAHSATIWMLLLTVFSIILGIVVALKIASVIINPVKELAENVDQVAKGNLTIEEINFTSHDELGKLGRDFNMMARNLRELVQQVFNLSQRVTASSQELSASGEEATKASEQITKSMQIITGNIDDSTNHINNLSSTVIQLSAGVEEVAANTQSVAANAKRSAEAAEKGNKEVVNSIEKMNDINYATEETTRAIEALRERSLSIGQIVEAITSIANQTNLLALNAAIEAARAGEAGRGFAVVAEEVRMLAEESAKATQEIAKIIREIQEETGYAVNSVVTSKQVVGEGIQAVTKASQSFQEILRAIEEVSSQVQDISVAMEQMAAGASNIADGISRIGEEAKEEQQNIQEIVAATEEQNASLEEISSSADILASMAQDLQETISKFRV